MKLTRPRAPLLRRAAVAVLSVLALSAAPAFAGPLYYLDFKGVVTNSFDSGNPASGGALFGGATDGGQVGQEITGRIVIDGTGYADRDSSPYRGWYEAANGLFPQPTDFFQASFSLASRSFNASEYMGAASSHSTEAAAVQDIPPVNWVQQDIYEIRDSSQRLSCSNPSDASTCNGGALASTELRLKLYGIYDFLSSDALVQGLDLDAADIAAITGAAGGGQDNQYLMYRYGAAGGLEFDARGQFALSSMTLRLAPSDDGSGQVPEPGSLALAALALAAVWRSRRPAGGGRVRLSRAQQLA